MTVKKYNEITDEMLKDYFKSITGKNKLLTDFGCLDIEVSRVFFSKLNMDIPVLYSWQFQLGETTILGRDSETYWEFIHRIKPLIGDKHQYNIYVHNLSYELEFLKGIFPNIEHFPNEVRKAMYAKDENIKYLCSYRLSGKSLEAFTKGCEHAKATEVGYDHEVERTPFTELSEDEIKYCVNDVLGLREAIIRLMDIKNCDLKELDKTLTNQRFTRRLLSKAYKNDKVKICQPSLECHNVLEYASHGAIVWACDSHRSAFFEDETSDKMLYNVHSYDATKFYTSILLGDKFPIGKWYSRKSIDEKEIDKLWMKTAWCGVATFENITLKLPNGEPVPCIVKSKASATNARWKQDTRLAYADKLQIGILDLDFDIIRKQYTWKKVKIEHVWLSDYGYLPNFLRDTIHKQYLKVKQLDKFSTEYEVEKQILNGFYGTCARNKNNVEVDNAGNVISMNETDYKNAVKFDCVNYAWGVWCTAWGRHHIQEAINDKRHQVVYIGSDSIKTIGPADFSEYNKNVCDKLREFNTKEDIMNPEYVGLGCFIEEYSCRRFKALKQVTYCCEFNKSIDELSEMGICAKIKDEDRNWAKETLGFTDEDFKKFNILITVSGVNKIKGSMQLFKDGGIEAFTKGYNFDKCYKLVRKVIDIPCSKAEYNGNLIPIHRGCLLEKEYGFVLGEQSDLPTSCEDIIDGLKEVILNDRFRKIFF